MPNQKLRRTAIQGRKENGLRAQSKYNPSTSERDRRMPSAFSEGIFNRGPWSPNYILGASIEKWQEFSRKKPDILFPTPAGGFAIAAKNHHLWPEIRAHLQTAKKKSWRETTSFIASMHGCHEALKLLMPPCVQEGSDLHIDLCMSRIRIAREFGSAQELVHEIVKTVNCYEFAIKLFDELYQVEGRLKEETTQRLADYVTGTYGDTPASRILAREQQRIDLLEEKSKNSSFLYTDCGGFRYALPSGFRSNHAVRAYLNGVPSEIEVIKAMADYLRTEQGNIIHGGAYFGDMIPRISKLIPESFLYAFEPDHQSYELARQTIIKNDLKNVLLYEFALGDRLGATYFESEYHSGEGIGGRSRVARGDIASAATTERVSIMSIDSLRFSSLSIIQLDIEGQELKALNGAIESIREFKPLIITEDCNQGIIDFLEDEGYKFWQRACNDYCWRHSTRS